MATADLNSNLGVDDPFAGVDFGQLERSLRRPRTLMDFLLSGLVTAMTLSALVPLFSVIWMLAWRGGKRLSAAVFTQLPPSAMEAGGGFGNAIVGTLLMVGLAVAFTVPCGIMTAIYLAQNRDSKLAEGVRFAAKVLTGFPSILAGVFAYGAIVLATGGYSADCGRSGALYPDAADDHPYLGGCHPHGAFAHEGGCHRHGRHADADGLDGSASYGCPGNSHWSDASGGSRRGRDRAAAVHCAIQQLLALVAWPRAADAPHRIARRPDL